MEKMRVIVQRADPVYGISIPKQIALISQGTYFKIEKSGTTIILTSGCKIEYTKKEIETYQYEDCKI